MSEDPDIPIDPKKLLEIEKLRLEIIELQTPWYKRPAFLVPFIGAISSILVLALTGFFNTKLEAIKTEQLKQKMELDKLTDSNRVLFTRKVQLQYQTQSLANQNKYIKNKTLALKQSRDKFLRDSIDLATASKNLKTERAVVLENKLILKHQDDSIKHLLTAGLRRIAGLNDSLKIAKRPEVIIASRHIYPEKDYRIFLKNLGNGIAHYKSFDAFYKGKRIERISGYEYMEVILSEIGLGNYAINWTSVDLPPATTGKLGAGAEHMLFSVSASEFTPRNVNQFETVFQNLIFKLRYCSFDNLCDSIEGSYKR